MLTLGKIVGGIYKLQHLIAEGGFSEIYLARSPFQWVAVKRLKPEFKKNSALLNCFKKEAELIATLRHPHVIYGLDYCEEEDECLIIMEYVGGRELGLFYERFHKIDLLMRTKIALSLSLAVCEALVYLHKLNIIHADLSPENMLLAFDGTIKLVDFGSAVQHQKDSSFLCGNVRYMAPEIKRGQRAEAPSDIYSLAFILLEILDASAGKYNFSNEMNLFKKILFKATHWDYQQRFHCAGEFLLALKKMAEVFNVQETKALLRSLWKASSKRKIAL